MRRSISQVRGRFCCAKFCTKNCIGSRSRSSSSLGNKSIWRLVRAGDDWSSSRSAPTKPPRASDRVVMSLRNSLQLGKIHDKYSLCVHRASRGVSRLFRWQFVAWRMAGGRPQGARYLPLSFFAISICMLAIVEASRQMGSAMQ